ncbi:MAG: transposase [Candidatus Thiodiazotropha endolucinida]
MRHRGHDHGSGHVADRSGLLGVLLLDGHLSGYDLVNRVLVGLCLTALFNTGIENANSLVAVAINEGFKSCFFEELLDEKNSSGDVWADSAYRDQAREETLPAANYRSHIHRKGTRKWPLNEREQAANRKRSRVRARVEHVFAQQANRLIRTIGKSRAEVNIGMMNLVYNMRRLAWLAG